MLDLIIDSRKPKRIITSTANIEETTGDKPIVSLLKTMSWRLVGTLDTMVISYVITGQVRSAISIGGIEVFSKMILYYFHERLWEKMKRSKPRK
ncbi:MAG TPA: DUF2061 domain-containing protein [Bacteroidales bacterium]|nr:DUF2061 domain-containing protein [Bacteroidales bacterium]